MQRLLPAGRASSPTMPLSPRPQAAGLYDPAFEHDACGIGAVARLSGEPSHEVVARALHVLDSLEHRGASGSEIDTGDGAGILLQVPHGFLREVVDFELPAPGHYAVGMCFLPREDDRRAEIEALIERTVADEGQEVLGWRDVPVDSSVPGPSSSQVEPLTRQVFVRSTARRPRRLRAQGLRHQAADRARRGCGLRGPVVLGKDGRLQGHAHLAAAAAVLPGPARRARSRPRWRSSTRASRPTPSRAGSSRTPTGSSATTARSTLCAGTSTGCAPASPSSRATCSATTSARCCPWFVRAAPTRRPSTTCSSS